MPEFLVQVNGTEPDGWRRINAETKDEAVCRLAVEHGQGRTDAYKVEVNVALGKERWPNGAPVHCQSFTVGVDPRTICDPATVVEGGK